MHSTRRSHVQLLTTGGGVIDVVLPRLETVDIMVVDDMDDTTEVAVLTVATEEEATSLVNVMPDVENTDPLLDRVVIIPVKVKVLELATVVQWSPIYPFAHVHVESVDHSCIVV